MGSVIRSDHCILCMVRQPSVWWPSFDHPFTLQLGYFCVRTSIWNQHTLEKLYGWVWVWNFPILARPYGWVLVWSLPYIYRLSIFIYGDVVGDVLWSNPQCFYLLISSIQRNPFVLTCPSYNKISYTLPWIFSLKVEITIPSTAEWFFWLGLVVRWNWVRWE